MDENEKIFLNEGFKITPDGYQQLYQVLQAQYLRAKNRLHELESRGDIKSKSAQDLREDVIRREVQLHELEAILDRDLH